MSAANPHARHGHATDRPSEVLASRSNYPVTEKMRWRTPGWLYQHLDREFHFDLDAAAEDGCALAPRWITHLEDCLVVDWRQTFRQRIGGADPTLVQLDHEDRSPVRSAFINPPWASRGLPSWIAEAHPGVLWTAFPGTGAFVQRAVEMARRGLTVAVLLPQATDAAWFKAVVTLADEVRIGRRFCFLDRHGIAAEQPPGGHLLLVFRPHVPPQGWPGGPRVTWDWNPQE